MERQLNRVFKIPLQYDTLQTKKDNGIPLAVTYYPAVIIYHLSSTIMNLSTVLRKSLNILYSDEKVKKFLTPIPFATYRSARNFKSFLLKSKVHT